MCNKSVPDLIDPDLIIIVLKSKCILVGVVNEVNKEAFMKFHISPYGILWPPRSQSMDTLSRIVGYCEAKSHIACVPKLYELYKHDATLNS